MREALERAKVLYGEGVEFKGIFNGRTYKSLGVFSLNRKGSVSVKCEKGKATVCHVEFGYYNRWAQIIKK